MAHYSQEKWLPDNNTDGEGVEAQSSHPTNEISTAFKELCDPQTVNISAATQTVVQLIDSAAPIEQATNATDEKFSQTVAELGQKNDSSIDSQAQLTEQRLSSTTVPIQINKRRRILGNFSPIVCSSETKPAEKKQDEYTSKIPKGSTKFICDGKIVSFDVEQLNGIKMLSHGANGSIYVVDINKSLGIRMAIKCIPLGRNSTGHSSADTELKTMKNIGSKKYPYIVDYYGAVINLKTGELCIGMELMDASITKFYQAMHSLDVISFDQRMHMVYRIIHDIASALYYLEKQRIVHRDIKPDNMLINTNLVTKLCDFGLCATLDEIKSNYSFLVGTSLYKPPEAAKNPIQDDMWALGISLLEIVSGKHPFADRNPYGLSFTILEWEPSVPTTISIDIRKLILHLLRKQPPERPGSFLHILADPLIGNVTEMPSNDKHVFIRHVFEKIHPTGSAN